MPYCTHFYLELYSFIDILSRLRNGMVFSFRLLWYLHLESMFENCTKKAAQESDSFPSGLRHVTFIYYTHLKHELTQVLSVEDKLFFMQTLIIFVVKMFVTKKRKEMD